MGSEISKLPESVCNSSASLDPVLSHRIFEEMKTDLIQAKLQNSPGFELQPTGLHANLYILSGPNGQIEAADIGDSNQPPAAYYSAIVVPCPGDKKAAIRFDRTGYETTIEHREK